MEQYRQIKQLNNVYCVRLSVYVFVSVCVFTAVDE